MSNKSKALRLADVLERSVNNPHRYWQGEAATELRRLHEVNQELLEALKRALPFMEAESVINGYGYYRPTNPHDFHPDHDICTEDEIAHHKAACAAYDAGNYRDDYGDGWLSSNLHVTKAPWGIGSYNDPIPELVEQCELARSAIAKATGGQS